jgi:hypothetical protein
MKKKQWKRILDFVNRIVEAQVQRNMLVEAQVQKENPEVPVQGERVEVPLYGKIKVEVGVEAEAEAEVNPDVDQIVEIQKNREVIPKVNPLVHPDQEAVVEVNLLKSRKWK